MKHISDLTNLKSYTPPTEKQRDLTRPSKVWVQLAEMFGKGFYRENSEQPTKLWQQAVWALTDEQIRNGLVHLGNGDLAFPPNLSQFVSACKRPPIKVKWVKSTAIEDLREPGRMPFAEWKQRNGK